MIKLLHPEIDLEAGRAPKGPPINPNLVGIGRTVLRLTNESERENAFKIDIECDHPFWQPEWVTMTTLLPDGQGETDSIKDDVPGPVGRQSIKATYLPGRKSRNVVIDFSADRIPGTRCGVYHLRIKVVQSIKVGDEGRTQWEHATLVVRPYYDWSAEISPSNQVVGRLRRSREFDVVVKNNGNDWLYVELTLPKAKEYLCASSCNWVALPPPDPGLDSVRSIPVKVTTRYKAIVGQTMEHPVALTLKRVDAPSVPPMRADSDKVPIGIGLSAPVYASVDRVIVSPEPASFTYQPIPKTFTEIGQFLARNIKGLVMFFIGLVVATTMIIVALGNLWRSATHPEITVLGDIPLNTQDRVHAKIPVEGLALEGVKAWIYGADGVPHGPFDVEPDLMGGPTRTPNFKKFQILYTDNSPLEAKRVGFRLMVANFPWPDIFSQLWERTTAWQGTVGNPDTKGEGSIHPVNRGEDFEITSSNLGFPIDQSTTATVILSGKRLMQVHYDKEQKDTVIFKSEGLAPGSYTIRIKNHERSKDLVLQIIEPPASTTGKESLSVPDVVIGQSSGSHVQTERQMETTSRAIGHSDGGGQDQIFSTKTSSDEFPGYDKLLEAIETHDLQKFADAYKEVRQSSGVVSLALKAISEAGRGGRNGMNAAFNDLAAADKLTNQTTPGIEKALVHVAKGMLAERNPTTNRSVVPEAAAYYSSAEDDMNGSTAGALPHLVYLDYLKRTGQSDSQEAAAVINEMKQMSLTQKESEVLSKLSP